MMYKPLHKGMGAIFNACQQWNKDSLDAPYDVYDNLYLYGAKPESRRKVA